MPVNYNYTQDGQIYSFDDVFVPADAFRAGNLWIWGFNGSGQLGNNASNNSFTPITTFSGGTNWNQISAGQNHPLAIKTDGTLWTWGNNSFGALGDNTTTQRSIPVTTFAGGTNWKRVAGGFLHTAAIKTDGTLWTWGSNIIGQLGDNTLITRSTPITTFTGGTNWKQVAGGFYNTAAIKTDGTLWTWGLNTNGQLGDNTTTNRSIPVTTFAGGTNWKQVACGYYHTSAIKTDGTLWTWGRNQFGQLGDNTTTDKMTPVTTFAGGTNWKQVSLTTFTFNTLAIKTDGTLWTWGRNNQGQLGDNTIFDKITPVTTFAGGTNWKQVSGGAVHTATIKTDGTLWSWGNGNLGILGDFSTVTKITPVPVYTNLTNWKQIFCGNNHTAAITYEDPIL